MYDEVMVPTKEQRKIETGKRGLGREGEREEVEVTVCNGV